MKKNQALEFKNQGNEYYKKGDYENALQSYGKAIEIDPEYRDAWNNLYVTLLKLEREDDAKKCKEILDKLTSEPEDLMKDQEAKKHSFLKKLVTGILILIVLVVIAVSTLAIYGWVVSHGTTSGSPEYILNSLITNGPAGINAVLTNSSSDGNGKYSQRNVAISASRIGGTITIRNYGGPDIGDVTSFTVTVDGAIPEMRLETRAGSSIIVNTPGNNNHIVVTAKFTDGQEQVVLDTFL
jgi:TPR repeat